MTALQGSRGPEIGAASTPMVPQEIQDVDGSVIGIMGTVSSAEVERLGAELARQNDLARFDSPDFTWLD